MTDESSASTLVLVAAILQLIFMFVGLGLTGLLLLGLAMFMTIDPAWLFLPPGVTLEGLIVSTTIYVTYFGLGTILALVFMILWFIWRSHPSHHRVGLIITGIIGLIMAGGLPGLLALIGGAIAPSPDTLEPPLPRKIQPKTTINYCPHCGIQIMNPNAKFCENCGATIR